MCIGKTDRIRGGYDRKAKNGKDARGDEPVGSDRLLLSLLTRAGLRDDRHALCVFRASQHARFCPLAMIKSRGLAVGGEDLSRVAARRLIALVADLERSLDKDQGPA
jgi:hypothetical protein